MPGFVAKPLVHLTDATSQACAFLAYCPGEYAGLDWTPAWDGFRLQVGREAPRRGTGLARSIAEPSCRGERIVPVYVLRTVS